MNPHETQHQAEHHSDVQPKPKDAPKVPDEYQADFKDFQAASGELQTSLAQMKTAIDALKPPDDPMALDKTRGIREAAAMLRGARGYIDEITRWVSPGPGGGIGGRTKDAEPKTVPEHAPAPSLNKEKK